MSSRIHGKKGDSSIDQIESSRFLSGHPAPRKVADGLRELCVDDGLLLCPRILAEALEQLCTGRAQPQSACSIHILVN